MEVIYSSRIVHFTWLVTSKRKHFSHAFLFSGQSGQSFFMPYHLTDCVCPFFSFLSFYLFFLKISFFFENLSSIWKNVFHVLFYFLNCASNVFLCTSFFSFENLRYKPFSSILPLVQCLCDLEKCGFLYVIQHVNFAWFVKVASRKPEKT